MDRSISLLASLSFTDELILYARSGLPIPKTTNGLDSRRRDRFTVRANFGVSVVVPVYNNADILPETIERLTNFFSQEFLRYELIFVDDGSTDSSWQILTTAAAQNQNIRLLRHARNLDQQQAVANGALAASEEIIVNTDADLPCLLNDLKKIAIIASQGTELVFGKRVGNLATPYWRRLATRIGGWIFRRLYGHRMSDFGCSTGAVRKSLVERMKNASVRIWLLKVELLRFAESYVEAEVRYSNYFPHRRSGYSLCKLAKRFAAIFWYKIIRPR